MPQAYFGVNRKNTISFEEQQLMQALETPDGPNGNDEARIKQIADSMSRLVQISISTVADSTEYIELEDGTRVSDPEYIKEFYNNATGEIVRQVQTRLSEINSEGAIKSQSASCIACTKEYQIPLTFDYASFFGKGF